MESKGDNFKELQVGGCGGRKERKLGHKYMQRKERS